MDRKYTYVNLVIAPYVAWYEPNLMFCFSIIPVSRFLPTKDDLFSSLVGT